MDCTSHILPPKFPNCLNYPGIHLSFQTAGGHRCSETPVGVHPGGFEKTESNYSTTPHRDGRSKARRKAKAFHIGNAAFFHGILGLLAFHSKTPDKPTNILKAVL